MKGCEQPILRGSQGAAVLAASGRRPDLRRIALLTLSRLRRYCSFLITRPSSRRLRLVETVSLGEKRFVSILQVDGDQFLLGGSGSAVTVLARLESLQPEQQESTTVSFAHLYSREHERQTDPSAIRSEEFAA